MSRLKNRALGITLGDPAGIGPEVAMKALAAQAVRKIPKIILIGDEQVAHYYRKNLPKNCIFEQTGPSFTKKEVGHPSPKSAKAALLSLKKAVTLLKNGTIQSLVTAPLTKQGIHALGHRNFKGHTEYLAESFGIRKYGMMFVAQKMKTIIVTRHIPIKRIAPSINKQNVYETIEVAHQALKRYFGLKSPKIAVCGLNPHAGEGGTLGTEERDIIIPALKKAKRKGIRVFGPFAADTLFTSVNAKNYDCLVGMYHDQGLVGIKSLYFDQLVNLTIGLPFARTSPAHGTAFDIAGKNKAHPSSMIEAIKLASSLRL